MEDNELLFSLSDILDKKLKPVNEALKRMELMQEHDILPRLQNIESCYVSTYRRYQTGADRVNAGRHRCYEKCYS